MILIIDNYDSFVYNLARYVMELGFKCLVKRNDEITLAEITRLNPSHIIISPGPCTPNEAGICLEIIPHFGTTIPILGVCLGHQAIGQAFGATISRAKFPMHGKSSQIDHDEKNIFKGLNNPLTVGRYHSLIVSEENLPKELIVTARCKNGEVMGISHQTFPIYGVQFHPESVLTNQGYDLLRNFLSQINQKNSPVKTGLE